jgi:hypothetical protein
VGRVVACVVAASSVGGAGAARLECRDQRGKFGGGTSRAWWRSGDSRWSTQSSHYDAYILDGRGGVGWHRPMVEHAVLNEEQPILREEGAQRASVEPARRRPVQRQI